MLGYPKVLLLSSEDAEARGWAELLREYADIRRLKNLNDLQSALERDDYDALFCGWSFHEGRWKDALERAQQRSPNLPVIIFSGIGGEQEWIQVLESGGFDLLVAPYKTRNVLSVLEQAVASSDARRFHHTGSYARASAS